MAHAGFKVHVFGQKAEPSSSALIFYREIKAGFPGLDLHNILFSVEYRKEFQNIFESGTVNEDITVYINISSKFEAADVPKNSENWFVMINTPENCGQNWDEVRKKARELIIKKINSTLNYDIEPLIEFKDNIDPVRIEAYTGSSFSSLYGSSNNLVSAFLRQANFSGSVHPGGGIPLCILGGNIASDIIINKYNARR